MRMHVQNIGGIIKVYVILKVSKTIMDVGVIIKVYRLIIWVDILLIY